MGSLELRSTLNPFMIASHFSVHALKAQLSFWIEEMHFYRQLVSWSIFGATGETKARLQIYLDNVIQFCESELMPFRTNLEAMEADFDVPSSTCLNTYVQLDEQTKQLKMQIFQHPEDLIKLRIW